MASSCLIFQRGISTTCVNYGKKNFRKFLLYNKRGSRDFKKKQSTDPYPEYPIDKRGVRDIGFKVEGRWICVPEMIPELIVPSLEGFTLKPYVSYKAENISQGEYTAEDLFNEVYAKKIKEDFNNQQLHPNGDPVNPSEYERLTPKEAADRAKRTGTDIFCEDVRYKYSNVID